MNAEQYLSKHWGPRHVWTHLKNKKHQIRLRRCAELVEGEAFADVGCAYGHSTEILAGFRAGRWVGIEFSNVAADKAREFFPSRGWLFAESVDQLDRWKGKFDSVVCSEVMEHVEDDALLVQRVAAMATKRAVFTTPSVKVSDPGHLRVYTPATLQALFFPLRVTILAEPPFYFIVVNNEL